MVSVNEFALPVWDWAFCGGRGSDPGGRIKPAMAPPVGGHSLLPIGNIGNSIVLTLRASGRGAGWIPKR